MLSESQERMLAVVKRGREAEALAVFKKWDLDAAVIGRVTDSGHIVLTENGQVVADLPIVPLAEGLQYERPYAPPADFVTARALDIAALPVPDDLSAVLVKLLESPNIGHKGWIWQKYDHMVRLGTVIGPGADAAVLRIFDHYRDPRENHVGGALPASFKGLALTTDCNPRFCWLDPYEGARLAVAEAYRNISTVGAEPLAITDCLNFGNPERPEIMWQLVEAIRGLGDACRALNTPVVSGNVSLYNETDGRAIKPTPAVGLVGLMADVRRAVGAHFADGLEVALLGDCTDELGGSEYLLQIHGKIAGRPPKLDCVREAAVGTLQRRLCTDALVAAAHDCSEGGLAVALVEACLGEQPVGLDVDVALGNAARKDALLFGEAASRIVIAFASDKRARIEQLAKDAGVPFRHLGRTGGRRFAVRVDGQPAIDATIETLIGAHRSGFRKLVS